MSIGILIILLLHGIVVFAYAAMNVAEPSTVWAMLSLSFVYSLGITQTGIVFSAVMKLTKSEWGKYYSRLGEILTLSFIPVVVIMFAVIYLGGMEHLFYWAAPVSESALHGGGTEHISPWLSKGLFFWRFIITMALFYIMSYIYFRIGRAEENSLNETHDKKESSNVAAAFVCVFYVIANTNLAWDFGMTIIKHWESSIFAPYYWCANLLVGTAFLFLISLYFIPRAPGEELDKNLLDSIGKVMLGFVLLVTYMFWSQHIVIWYGNLPTRTGPLFKQMSDAYGPAFTLMLLMILVVPFFALLFRRIKLSVTALSVVAVIICFGILINRYLMIIPVYSDGDLSATAIWAGIALIIAGVSAALLSVKFFLRLFPDITVTTGEQRSVAKPLEVNCDER